MTTATPARAARHNLSPAMTTALLGDLRDAAPATRTALHRRGLAGEITPGLWIRTTAGEVAADAIRAEVAEEVAADERVTAEAAAMVAAMDAMATGANAGAPTTGQVDAAALVANVRLVPGIGQVEPRTVRDALAVARPVWGPDDEPSTPAIETAADVVYPGWRGWTHYRTAMVETRHLLAWVQRIPELPAHGDTVTALVADTYAVGEVQSVWGPWIQLRVAHHTDGHPVLVAVHHGQVLDALQEECGGCGSGSGEACAPGCLSRVADAGAELDAAAHCQRCGFDGELVHARDVQGKLQRAHLTCALYAGWNVAAVNEMPVRLREVNAIRMALGEQGGRTIAAEDAVAVLRELRARRTGATWDAQFRRMSPEAGRLEVAAGLGEAQTRLLGELRGAPVTPDVWTAVTAAV